VNSGQNPSPGPQDAEVPEADTDSDLDPNIDDLDPNIDTESLQRSRDAIDQGREAAREALPDDADVAGDAEG
jgi:hypothetical protein